MEQKILERDFIVSRCMDKASLTFPFSFAFFHRKSDNIQCYREDPYSSMYSYRGSKGKLISNMRPEENIEIEILNFVGLRDIYLNKKGFTLDTPQIEERFCRDMYIFSCDGRYYIRYAIIMMDFLENAKFIAELWSMAFVYILLANEDKKVLDPNNIHKQKDFYFDFEKTCFFRITNSELVNQ